MLVLSVLFLKRPEVCNLNYCSFEEEVKFEISTLVTTSGENQEAKGHRFGPWEEVGACTQSQRGCSGPVGRLQPHGSDTSVSGDRYAEERRGLEGQASTWGGRQVTQVQMITKIKKRHEKLSQRMTSSLAYHFIWGQLTICTLFSWIYMICSSVLSFTHVFEHNLLVCLESDTNWKCFVSTRRLTLARWEWIQT